MKRLWRYVEAALATSTSASEHAPAHDRSLGGHQEGRLRRRSGHAGGRQGGELHLCHRFTGLLPSFGSSRPASTRRLGGFIEKAQDKASRACGTCRIRNVCAGGCYHESYARFEDLHSPVYHCELMRDWVDFGIDDGIMRESVIPETSRRTAEVAAMKH